MPIPEQRDPEHTRAALAGWLEERMPQARGVEILDMTVPEGTGYSNETLLLDVRWEEEGASRTAGLVARVSPVEYAVFPESDVDIQYRSLKALRENSDVPVPEVYWLEKDPSVLGASFFVMERLEGRAPPDTPPYNLSGWLTDLSDEERRTLWSNAVEVLAAVHRLDPDESGFGFADRRELGPRGISQMLAYLEHQKEFASGGGSNPPAEAGWAWLNEHAPSSTPDIGISWGDARIGNIMFDGLEPVAACDWEMVALGPGEQDLGWWLFLDRFHSEGIGVERLGGLGDRDETIARYEELVGRRVDLGLLDFYEVLAAFRFTLVMMRITQLQKHYGQLPESSDRDVNNPVVNLLMAMID